MSTTLSNSFLAAAVIAIIGGHLPFDAFAADQVLERNPFSRPALVQGAAAAAAGDDSDGEMILRATLVAGEKSTANINGKFIRIGEAINGYTLVSVDEGKAVFKKDGIPVTVAVFDAILDGQNGDY